MNEIFSVILALVISLSIAAVAIIYYLKNKFQINIKLSQEKAKLILDNALKEADTKKKEAILEAKEETHRLRNELDKESKDRRKEAQQQEKRLIQREELLDRKSESLEKKDALLNNKISKVEESEKELENVLLMQKDRLEVISGLTQDQAKETLLKEIEKEIKQESAILIKELEANAKEEADKKAREIITYAIQKCAADHVVESTVHVVSLPSDDMKGRIIGREGRNIRTLETLTGVDLIIDDTPEAVILSAFDPIRREVARLALEKLIIDGRIHPARIEELVEKAKKEIETIIKEEGEQAAFEVGVHGLHVEIIKILGKLKYRTSYGQNVLKHSIEVSQLAGFMASELGLDPTVAKRAGLLHDIGKAIDSETSSLHAIIGAEYAKKYHENAVIVNSIAAHHLDVEQQSIEAVLVQAADAVSAARPGARRETIETYIKRLEKLEEIANSYEGVERSYAIQAGREIRIMVKPDAISDDQAIVMARDMVKKIESELEYPGQIKINVIRETRAIEYAK